MTTYKLSNNEQFKSIELAFESMPTKKERDILKTLKFRWHSIKKVWYGYATAEQIEKALNGSIEPAKKEITNKYGAAKKEITNKYGVKVGDVFHASWGYEQTNNNFYQVTELVGSCTVRIVEVCPDYTVTKSMPMAEYRIIEPINNKMLPRVTRSFSVQDQDKGDIHKIGNYEINGNNNLYIKVSGAKAHPFNGGKVYESWYY